jgi:NADPH:quinone reductase-like Zn-dependent oxidoreductase
MSKISKSAMRYLPIAARQQFSMAGYAEEIALEEEHVAPKPKKLSFAQAAAIPLVGLTAWQALRDMAKLQSGVKMLILGGAGGVGSFATALAKYLGAHVYTTASPANWEYVKKLGAKEIVDYQASDWSAQLRKLALKVLMWFSTASEGHLCRKATTLCVPMDGGFQLLKLLTSPWPRRSN